jgi:hypothetical protein
MNHLIRRAITAWKLWSARRRVLRAVPEIAAIPPKPRNAAGRYVSPAKLRRKALHDRLRQETAR